MGIGTGLYMYDVIVKKFSFAMSSPDEFLVFHTCSQVLNGTQQLKFFQFSKAFRYRSGELSMCENILLS